MVDGENEDMDGELKWDTSKSFEMLLGLRQRKRGVEEGLDEGEVRGRRGVGGG